MILHLDSTFRNIQQYPLPSEFELDFNGQPSRDFHVRDVRGEYVTKQFAQYSFRWVGNETSTLYGIPNDTLTVQVIPLNAFSCLLTTPDQPQLYQLLSDYFVGTIMQNLDTGLSSVVAMYSGSDFVFTLDQPIFSSFSSVSYTEYLRSTDTTNLSFATVSITNPTYTAGNNLLILGSTSLIASSPTEFALSKGINTALFVENVTQKWTSKIKSIVGTYRSVILESFPSYKSGDVFIVWLQNLSYTSNEVRLHLGGVQDFFVAESGPFPYSIGDKLYSCDRTIVFEVIQAHPLQLRCLQAGSQQIIGTYIWVKRPQDTVYHVKIGILQIGHWLAIKTENGSEPLPPSLRNVTEEKNPFFLMGILNPTNYQMMYFSVVKYAFPLVYLNITADEAQAINTSYVDAEIPFRFFVIPFVSFFPSINAPIVPYQNATCFLVSIASVSLPNLPVCGFDVLLSDIPYILVTLVNVNTPNNDSYGTLVSNNPSSFSAQFVCPIANIRNPNLVKFVVVSSNQKTLFKFTPRNSLKFRVTLPNGELLQYNNAFVPYQIPCQTCSSATLPTICTPCSTCLTLPLTPCPSINQPLNTNTLDDNAMKVYPLTYSNLISATFTFTPV